MEKVLEPLHQSLQKLIGFHRQLLDTVRLEREALIEAQTKSVQEVTLAKHALLISIQQEEVTRLKHVAAIALVWKRPLKELTLPNLIIAIQVKDPKASEQFRSSFNALTLLIQRITEQNDYNKALVERSLEHVNEMKRNVLGEGVPRSNTYTAQGQRIAQTGGARMISKEA